MPKSREHCGGEGEGDMALLGIHKVSITRLR